MQLCQICSAFNLAQEFRLLIKQFQIESDLSYNFEIKLQTDNLIKNLKRFIHSIEEHHDKIRRKRRPPMQIIYHEQSIEKKSCDINHLKTSDLIELYHKNSDQCLIPLIINELYQRVQGKSTEPLLTSEEIIIINKYLEKYKHKTVHELSYSYHKLQQQINASLQSNILNILNVNSEILIENFIVQTLLNDKEKNENNSQYPKDESQRSTMNSFPQPMLKTTSQTLLTSTSQPILTKISQPVHPLAHPTMKTKSPSTNSTLLGFAHLTSAPYPSLNDPSPMPALPADFSPIIHRKTDQSQGFVRPVNNRHDLADRKGRVSTSNYQDFTPMPMPLAINKQEPLNNLYNSNVGYPLNGTIEHQSTTSSNERPSRPDVIPTPNNFSTNNQLLVNPSKPFFLANIDNEDFDLFDNSSLILLYRDANIKNHQSRKAAIYHELEQRCHGNYPMLINEKKNLFQEIIQTNTMKTTAELMIEQAAIHTKIRGYLRNDDATMINDIPPELIVEAGALKYLILSKEQA